MLNILKSLRRRVSSYDLFSTRLNNRYNIENLYSQISEDVDDEVQEIRVTYLTPNEIYGKKVRIHFDEVDEVEKVTTSYIFPKKECKTYECLDFCLSLSQKYEQDRRDYMLNYTKRSEIMKNNFLIGDSHIIFSTERYYTLYLYSMRDGKRDIRRGDYADYYDEPSNIRIKYHERYYHMNSQHYKYNIELDDGRLIKIVGFREDMYSSITVNNDALFGQSI
jgi:hypothetical protein